MNQSEDTGWNTKPWPKFLDHYKAHNNNFPNNVQDFVTTPGSLKENLNYAIEAAFWYWDDEGINVKADNDDVRGVTWKINRGYNGLEDRTARLQQIKNHLGI